MIDGALTQASGSSFAKLFDTRIRQPLGLESTVPNPRAAAAMEELGLPVNAWATRLARGYSWDAKGGYSIVAYESYFGPAAGLISRPSDIVRFSRAFDDGTLINAASRTRMWTPVKTADGRTLPYAIGWFVQQYRGETVMWHYGYGPAHPHSSSRCPRGA
jgi:CubicO group peptidase (beta-lactamase class C family)